MDGAGHGARLPGRVTTCCTSSTRNSGQFELAERAASKGLVVAARLAGLPKDWRRAINDTHDFMSPGPARFWLFTLKALAFIALRRQQPELAAELLARIKLLDPLHTVGGDVIAALLRNS